MDDLTVWVAKYLLYVMVVIFVAVWLFAERRAGRIELTVAAIVGLACCGLFILLAGHLHDDPRPFVDNPALHPLFAHSADNGFPSDHSVAAGLLATLVLVRHRLVGLLLWLCAIAVAAARVHAHVHHVQDVVAGLLLGVLAALIGLVVARLVARPLATRRAAGGPGARHGAARR